MHRPDVRPRSYTTCTEKTNADEVYIGARATSSVDLYPQLYLQNASGEAKPHLITDFVSDIVTDTGNLTGTRGYMDTE